MRLANAGGRAALVVDGRVHDLAGLSGGAIAADPMTVIAHQWDEAREWEQRGTTDPGTPMEGADLQAAVPRPGSVFAVGINYHGHAKETGAEVPDLPAIFT